MRTKKELVMLIAILLVGTLGFVQHVYAKDMYVKVLGLTLGGGGHLFAAQMAELIDRSVPGVSGSAATGSTAPNVKNVCEGRGDIGFSSPIYEAQAWNGTDRFKGKPMKNIRHLFFHCGTAQVMFTLNKSSIKSYEDLKDKRINAGTKGYTSTQACLAALKAYGLTPEVIKANGGSVSYADSNDAARMLQDRTIDAMFANSGEDEIEDQLLPVEEVLGVRIIKLSPEKLKKQNELMPGTYLTRIKGGVYKHESNDIPTLGAAFTMICRDDMPDEVAYNIVKTVFEHQDLFRALKGPWVNFDLSDALKGAYLPVHPGAMKYYKEMGIKN